MRARRQKSIKIFTSLSPSLPPSVCLALQRSGARLHNASRGAGKQTRARPKWGRAGNARESRYSRHAICQLACLPRSRAKRPKKRPQNCLAQSTGRPLHAFVSCELRARLALTAIASTAAAAAACDNGFIAPVSVTRPSRALLAKLKPTVLGASSASDGLCLCMYSAEA